MKYGIDAGYNLCGYGEREGKIEEEELVKEIGYKIIEKLKSRGYSVVNCIPSKASSIGDSLHKRVLIANMNNVDIFISVNFTAGEEIKTEIFAVTEEERCIAKKILNEMKAQGFIVGGIKDGSKIYLLKNIRAKAIFIKNTYVEFKEYIDLYGGEKMAQAITEAIDCKNL